jgi:hypothetical protein
MEMFMEYTLCFTKLYKNRRNFFQIRCLIFSTYS